MSIVEEIRSGVFVLMRAGVCLGQLKTIVTRIEFDVLHVSEELKYLPGMARNIVGTAAVMSFSANRGGNLNHKN